MSHKNESGSTSAGTGLRQNIIRVASLWCSWTLPHGSKVFAAAPEIMEVQDGGNFRLFREVKSSWNLPAAFPFILLMAVWLLWVESAREPKKRSICNWHPLELEAWAGDDTGNGCCVGQTMMFSSFSKDASYRMGELVRNRMVRNCLFSPIMHFFNLGPDRSLKGKQWDFFFLLCVLRYVRFQNIFSAIEEQGWDIYWAHSFSPWPCLSFMHPFPWSQLWGLCASLTATLWAEGSDPCYCFPTLARLFMAIHWIGSAPLVMNPWGTRWNADFWARLSDQSGTLGGAGKHVYLAHTPDGLWNTLWEMLP